MILHVVGHLHLVLATALQFLLFPPCQKEGRFSGLNCCHHCHDWNLCFHLGFYGHSWSAFLSFFLPRRSCHKNHIFFGMFCFVLFQPLEVWIWNWLVKAFSNYAHKHSVTVLLVHHSDMIYQISFHNCSVRTFFTVELSFICLVLTVQIFMLDYSSFCLHYFTTFSALPPFS